MYIYLKIFSKAKKQDQNWERGQDLAEYAILLGLLALALLAAVTVLGININTVFSSLASRVGAW